jgi:hypothetical protein
VSSIYIWSSFNFRHLAEILYFDIDLKNNTMVL